MQLAPVRSLYLLPNARKRALIKAAAVLPAASLAVGLLPFRAAMAFGSRALGRPGAINPEDCVWAVEAVARRLPWRTVCIQKGLAVQRLLRSAGVDAQLHYGARRSAESGELEAHVWVSVGGETIIGGEDAAGLPEIARFP